MRALVLIPGLLVCSTCLLSAQWRVGVELAMYQYHGSSHDTSASHVISEGGPGGGLAFGLSLSHSWRRHGVMLQVSYAEPGFAVRGNGVNLTDKTTGKLLELSTLFSTQVGGIGSSGAIRAGLGPALHLWDYDGEYRSRVGAVGAVAYEWGVSSRFTGAVRLDGMLSPSWFDATDLPPEFERQATWRYGWGVGLRYRL